MLISLRLQNFRCFAEHALDLRPTTVIVGRNNAGKSTLVEALQLVSIAANRFKNLRLGGPPEWAGLPLSHRGVAPSVEGLGIDFEAIFHRYGPPPAVITGCFASGEELRVFVGPKGELHVVARGSDRQIASTPGESRALTLPSIQVLPQVAPLLTDEEILRPDYVMSNLSSRIAFRHFRNQLRLLRPEYVRFRSLAEQTWPGLQISSLEGAQGEHGDPLSLLVRDADFVAEVARMGHGLQMWLQMIWFLARTDSDSVIILDEPDVYMHADLQRRVMRLIKGKYQQVIVATHSVEIMSEVSPSDILVVDHRRKSSAFADSQPAVQRLIDHIGSVHNLSLARLWNAQRFLLVEGEDLAVLKHFHALLFPKSTAPLDDIPNAHIGGWGGWTHVVGSAMLLRNAVGKDIKTYCLLDRDYHTPAEVGERYTDAADKNVRLHVWQKKELENYLLCAEVIQRVIASRPGSDGRVPDVQTIKEQIGVIAASLKEDTIDSLATAFKDREHKISVKTANEQARAIVRMVQEAEGDLSSIVSGKELLGQLSAWSSCEFGISFGPMAVVREFHADELDPEIAQVLSCLERGSDLPAEQPRRSRPTR
jgi:predicted ATPase